MAFVIPDEEECYLLAILDSIDGLDLAEFAMHDPESGDGCYRAWPVQWEWYLCTDTYQADQCSRAVGKSFGIKMRAFAMPFARPGQSMLLTAPELNHLQPLTSAIEDALLGTRLTRELLPSGKGNGIRKQPHWECRFQNGTKIVSRLPNKDGKGVKGCVAEGTIVLTKRGLIPIEGVEQGDEVLTHMGRWRRVLGTFKWTDADIVTVSGGGHAGLGMSDMHDMLLRRNRNPHTRNLGPATWVTPAVEYPDEIEKRWYMGSPTDFPEAEQIPEWATEEFMWVIGRYVADGHLAFANKGKPRETSGRICFTVKAAEKGELVRWIKQAGFDANAFLRDNGTYSVEFYSTDLARAVRENFGEHAHGKRLPVWLLGAPCDLQWAFLHGYLSGDGSWSEEKQRWALSTASKPLAIGMRLLGQALGYVASYGWVDPKVTHIRGKALKAKPMRSHRVYLRPNGSAVHEDGVAWQKIRRVKPGGTSNVYDLAVEEDQSYIADGLISHNQHVICIELDEAQNYPLAGWIEIVECLNRFLPGAVWRAHGVPKGARDKFYDMTEGAVDGDRKWTVHRIMAMNRPTWSAEERQEKIKEYGGSRQNIDYKRNIYGEHGDATNAVFVLAKLMACVDLDLGSVYNTDVYKCIRIELERVPQGLDDLAREAYIVAQLDIPGEHKTGYSQRVNHREAGSPKGYSAYYAGMDVGVTNHPSEILVYGQRMGTDVLELLLRVNMQRINTDDQKAVAVAIMDWYGDKMKSFAIDKTGVGFPIWDQLSRHPVHGKRVYGYNFSEKLPVALEDRPLERGETVKDLVIERNFVEAATDWLRNDYVDLKRLRMPNDRELLLEHQGQVYCCSTDTEILTKRGWLKYDQLQPGDFAVGLNDDGTSDWTEVSAVHIFPAAPREMLSMEHIKHSSLTTLDHRWYARRVARAAPIEVVTSRDLLSDMRPNLYNSTKLTENRYRIPITAEFQGNPVEPFYSDDFVELVAWFWTEGNWTPSGGFAISQSFTANPKHTARIARLLGRMLGPGICRPGRGNRCHGYPWSFGDAGTSLAFRVLDRDVRAQIRAVVDSEKVVSPDFITKLTREQLELFINVSLCADGCEFHRHGGLVRELIQCHKGRTAAFEMACALAGRATRTRVSGERYTVTISNERYTNTTSAVRKIVVHDGEVWCPVTGSGNWLARRNGKVYFTGNSVIKDTGTPYGTKRVFSGGSFHTLDAAKLAIGGKMLPEIQALLEKTTQKPVLEQFVDMF